MKSKNAKTVPLSELEELLGYRFRDRSLLQTALTHSSYANEHSRSGAESYERLEFLGDSILGAVTADYLYRRRPALPEGDMTRIRAELVCEESLYRVACDLSLSRWMRLGRGEELSGGRKRPSILADMVEAVIAAVCLDGGLEAAGLLIRERVLQDAEATILNAGRDAKSALQELVQKENSGSVRYEETGETGPDHDKRFLCAVFVNGVRTGEGEGRSKKEAEQAAAAAALKKLRP